MRNYLLSQMTWEEAKEALEKADFVIVPIGSHEQHGLHMTFEVDTALGYGVAKRVIEDSFPDLKILLAPKISYGVSEHHMHFPGTISVKPDTLMSVVSDVCESLSRHGIKDIILLNAHGGNRDAINIAATIMQHKLNVNILTINTFWSYGVYEIAAREAKTWPWGHSGEFETSMMMFLSPEGVRREKIQKVKAKSIYIEIDPLKKQRVILTPISYSEKISKTGAYGDPTTASKELGSKLINTVVERIISTLKWHKTTT
jgi:creatinine amidohydrolase